MIAVYCEKTRAEGMNLENTGIVFCSLGRGEGAQRCLTFFALAVAGSFRSGPGSAPARLLPRQAAG
jgi:hypothetical protein